MSDKQTQILKMVENKEITVEEALRRLREDQEDRHMSSADVREAVSQVLNEVGTSLKEAGVAVNEVMTDVGNELRSNQDVQSVLASLLSGIRTLGVGTTFEFDHEGQFAAETVRIILKGANGALTVQSWDKPGYLLRTRVGVRRGQSDATAREYAAQSYRVVAVTDSLLLEIKAGVHDVSVSGVLYLPESHRYDVELSTSNGAIRADKLRGQQFVADTSNGSVTLEQCDFRLARIETSNGAVTVSGGCGDVNVRTSNGGIRVQNPGVPAKESDLDLATSNGSITISLKRDMAVGYRVDASTSNGRVRAELEGLAVRTTGKNQLHAESDDYPAAASKVQISARTSNGSVNITHV